MTADRIDRLNMLNGPDRLDSLGVGSIPAGRGPSGTSGSVPVRPGRLPQQDPNAAGARFQDILADQLRSDDVRFSAHAQARLAARRIALGEDELGRLAVGVNRAAAKGSRESLVLMDDKAFVVSVKNRTVITAVDGEHLRENVFTNIDSAVIV